MAALSGKAFQKFLEIASPHIPLLKDSKFKETGVLTADEFVLAGDFLVYHCPTWRWETGDDKMVKDYLPKDKQFLATRNVPCYQRLKQMQFTEENEVVLDEDDPEGGWVDTHHNIDTTTTKITDSMDDMNIEDKPRLLSDTPVGAGEDDEESAGEMTDDEEDGPEVEDNDPAEVRPTTTQTDKPVDSNTVNMRSYDLYITYDRYYQTPRMWLFGYNENRKPLTIEETYEDISSDHVKKTVTQENHPHFAGPGMLSIHPCKHAEVIKRIIEQTAQGGRSEVEVHMYLLIFLKFVQSVLPTIEYDYTQQFTMSG